MQVMPIDVTEIVAVVLGLSVVLIPIAGLTARFALKPVVEAFGRLGEHRGLEETVAILERRLDLLEAQNESMDRSIRRIADAVEFDRKLLESGEGPEPETPAAGGHPGNRGENGGETRSDHA